ncbi:XK-related protein 4-like isoform X2 [Paramormyrops kingsleyae]|uniref:XK-related protein n=1 Tax=Paramormyrops kingsleyae TaxID=1676925 RepID=A0A3B3SG20_9TELE|nr:XK-related protein 4-like isoform X2 [Paramormyrops kingsleyae]
MCAMGEPPVSTCCREEAPLCYELEEEEVAQPRLRSPVPGDRERKEEERKGGGGGRGGGGRRRCGLDNGRAAVMAAKSDGVLKMRRGDVAFTPLQDCDQSQGMVPGSQPGSGAPEGDLVSGEPRCCGSSSACLRLGRQQRDYSVWDCLWILAAAAVYLADVGTDVWLSVDYYFRRDYWWFGLTLFFAVLGSFSVQLFSFRWFVHDFGSDGSAGAAADRPHTDGKVLSASASHGDMGSHPSAPQASSTTASISDHAANKKRSCSFCIWLLQSIIHILQLGQIWRYFRTIYLGVRSRRSRVNDRWRFYWRMVYEYADISMLHLLATFLESAPQLVLQLCIIIQTHKLQALQGLTAAASLVSLAWALASYQKALRESRDDKKPLYFGVFIVLHWCVMTFWIVHCETEFCVTKWEEIVFDMVVGVVYIFSWFNVKEGRTRYRLFVYYLVVLLENAALSTLWYLYRLPSTTDAFAIPALCVIFSSFLTGVLFMLMYYAFFHPNGPRFGRSPSSALEDPVGGGAATSPPPPEGATNSLRAGQMRGGSSMDIKYTERDGCTPVFQVRPLATPTPSSRPPRIEESVIKIDLFRNRYPAWERHVLDRSIRKAILGFECSPAPPRLQYKDDALVQERLEYETTL